MKHKIILSILVLLISFSAFSAPARKGMVYLTQPDGTSFSARISGDEFMKIVTTSSGEAVIQDSEGWWCYASYDGNGLKSSSGYRVGQDAPDEVKTCSRMIPYGRIASNAGMKRMAEENGREPIMSRIMRKQGIDTRSGKAETVTKHGLVILAQFKDMEFTHTKDDFVKMLTQKGYSKNGATGSAKEYFDAQFNGAIQFQFDVSSIVTLPNSMAFYGGNGPDGSDKAPAQMVIDACRLADNEIDFSVYDDDGDGAVDNVFVFFAGGDEAEGAGEDRIWSHAWHIISGAGKLLVLDGKRIDRYACTSELTRIYDRKGGHRDVLAGIGTFCHEYFHTFGIPDLYDTDYEESGGRAGSLWMSTALMDAGNQNNDGNTPPYLNAVERDYLGISQPEVIEDNGGYSLEPINRSGKYYRLNTDYENEYYLLECRAKEGWDSHIGGEGMLIYHIDKSDRDAGFSDSFAKEVSAEYRWELYNEVNCRPDHQCADLVEADARKDRFTANETEDYYISSNNITGIFFPGASASSLYPDSKPGITYWSGKKAETSITNIRRTDEGVTFNVLGFGDATLPPEVASIRTEAFTDAAIIQFESDRLYTGEATFIWSKAGGQAETISVKPYLPGRYAVTLEGLQSDNKTYVIKIHFELDGLIGKESSASFMTKKTPVVKWPFIYMGGVAVNSDGTLPAGSRLPLRVYNGADAAEISWEFDGKAVTTEGDGYFKAEKSGELKARIIWKDGSEETIMKEIIIGEERQ